MYSVKNSSNQASGLTGLVCFAFEKWHSAIEMRRYILRFIHHIDGLLTHLH